MSLLSALLLGAYDVAKKFALRRNGVLYVLLSATAFTALFLCPWLSAGPAVHHLMLVLKAALVASSWITGMMALERLPITIVSPIKASRPMFVVLLSILLYGEHLNWVQWTGVVAVIGAMLLMSRSGSKEGIHFRSNRGVWALFASIFTGVASALWDKHIMAIMEPLFVQSWTNIYITVLLAAAVAAKAVKDGPQKRERFRWDWTLPAIAVLITGADALYFFSLKDPDALLSVVSLIRRCSVVVTFALGAAIFKEKNLRGKALIMLLMLAGTVLLLLGSM